MSDPDLIYLSLGAGVQSSALYVMAVKGELGRVDCAIFADTQAEPRHVYEQLDRLEAFGGDTVPIHRVTAGNLHTDSIGGTFMRIPAFTRSENGEDGITRRQCTREYKVAPIRREVRRLLGLAARERANGKRAIGYIGISADEASRMKPSRESYIEHRWPLIDRRLRRDDCRRIVMDAGLPEPKRSACYFCPFKSQAEWRFLRDHAPTDWAKAVAFDAAIRNSTRAGLALPVFVHRSRRPLSEAPIDGEDTVQSRFAFDNECEGLCGV